MTFDPRTISTPVYEALNKLKSEHSNNKERLREQKGQAVEIYTYLSTWGMMRLKAEEQVVKEGKQDVIAKYFTCLEELSGIENLSGSDGLSTIKNLDPDPYLGLTGLGLEVAKEFSFWANAIYHDVKAEAN